MVKAVFKPEVDVVTNLEPLFHKFCIRHCVITERVGTTSALNIHMVT